MLNVVTTSSLILTLHSLVTGLCVLTHRSSVYVTLKRFDEVRSSTCPCGQGASSCFQSPPWTKWGLPVSPSNLREKTFFFQNEKSDYPFHCVSSLCCKIRKCWTYYSVFIYHLTFFLIEFLSQLQVLFGQLEE